MKHTGNTWHVPNMWDILNTIFKDIKVTFYGFSNLLNLSKSQGEFSVQPWIKGNGVLYQSFPNRI